MSDSSSSSSSSQTSSDTKDKDTKDTKEDTKETTSSSSSSSSDTTTSSDKRGLVPATKVGGMRVNQNKKDKKDNSNDDTANPQTTLEHALNPNSQLIGDGSNQSNSVRDNKELARLLQSDTSGKVISSTYTSPEPQHDKHVNKHQQIHQNKSGTIQQFQGKSH